MPLDPRIPLQAEMPDFAGIYGNALKARQQNMLAAKEQEDVDFAKQQKNRLAQIYSQAVNPQTGAVDRNMLLKGLAGGGRGELIPALQTEFAQQDKAKTEAEAKQLELHITNTRNAREEIARAMGKNDAVEVARRFVANGALDPETANSIVQAIPDDPKQFPGWQRNFTMQLLDAEKRMDAEYKQKQIKVQEGQLAVSRGNLGVAQQNANTAAARLAFDMSKPQGPQPTYTEIVKSQQADKAKKDVSSLVTTLGTYYKELAKRGGAVKDGGSLGNVASYLGGTFGFKEIPQALGTEAASTRTKITSARRALVEQIRKATGMGSKEMDSNQELQAMLDAATDPRQPLEAVEATLNNINRLYGTGGDIVRLNLGDKPAASGGANKNKPTTSGW